MLTYVHLCTCISWNHLDHSSFHSGLCLHISWPATKSGMAAHLSFLCGTACWQGCCCSPSQTWKFPSCSLALAAGGYGQEMLAGLWGTVQNCILSPNFPKKEEESSLISLNCWCVFRQDWSSCVLWEEIQYKLNVFFKSLAKDRDIPITNQN